MRRVLGTGVTVDVRHVDLRFDDLGTGHWLAPAGQSHRHDGFALLYCRANGLKFVVLRVGKSSRADADQKRASNELRSHFASPDRSKSSSRSRATVCHCSAFQKRHPTAGMKRTDAGRIGDLPLPFPPPAGGTERSGRAILAKAMGLAIPGSVLALGQHVALTIAHAKGVTLCENFQRNAMKSGGEHEFAAAVFPTGSDTGGSGCDARLRASHAHSWGGQ